MLNRVIVAWAVALALVSGAGWGRDQRAIWVVDSNDEPIANFKIKINSLANDHSLEAETGPDGKIDVPPSLKGTLRLISKQPGFFLDTLQFKIPKTGLKVKIGQAETLWNSWALKDGEQHQASQLTVGPIYTVNFDLAGVRYGSILDDNTIPAFSADPNLADLQEGSALLVKPFIQGEGLRLVNEHFTADRQVFKKEKLLKAAEFLVDWSNLPPDQRNLATLSEKLGAVHIPVPVQATGPGQALVGLAIWNAATQQPLEFVTFQATVTESVTSQQSTNPPFQIKAHLHNLLGSPSAPHAEAGISIFEFGSAADGSLRNTVIFLGPEKGKDHFARSWSPRRSIREYVSLDGQFGMARQLALVQCRENFTEIADFFSGVLFSAPDKTGQQAADDALQKLQELLDAWPESADPPVISTRFIDAAGNSLPIPLGVLGVRSKKAKHLLGEVATVSQPLPIDRSVTDEGCIKTITTILPSSLGMGDGCECAALDELLRPRKMPSPPFLQSIEDVGSYFAQSQNEPVQEGVLLLSHHVNGFVSFTPDFSKPLQAERMTREYGKGSVAILVGCTVGSLTPLNRSLPLISALNEKGVDAMIFSPFTLSATLGARLGVYFSEEIENAHDKPITLLGLYRKVIEDVRKDPAAKPFLGELSLLSLSGSGNIKLCPVAQPTKLLSSGSPAQNRTCKCNTSVRIKEWFQKRMARALGGGLGPIETDPKSGVGIGSGERAAAKQCREAAAAAKAEEAAVKAAARAAAAKTASRAS